MDAAWHISVAKWRPKWPPRSTKCAPRGAPGGCYGHSVSRGARNTLLGGLEGAHLPPNLACLRNKNPQKQPNDFKSGPFGPQRGAPGGCYGHSISRGARNTLPGGLEGALLPPNLACFRILFPQKPATTTFSTHYIFSTSSSLGFLAQQFV